MLIAHLMGTASATLLLPQLKVRHTFTTHQLSLLYVTPKQSTMAAVMTATPTTPMTAATTTVPLPNYQVSGVGGVAAAAPRHGASSGSSGSVGAFFGVLAAVLVLTVLSCVFGRVCAAQAQGPDESYDCTRLARWRRSAHRRRPVVPAAETKQPAAPPLPLPEP